MPERCPTDEELAAFVEHRRGDRAALEAHLDGCESCRLVAGHAAARAGANVTLASAVVTVTSSPPTVATPPPGASPVDRYAPVRELGRGGMGVVLAAFDSQLHRHVALKLVRPEDDDEQARARLVREARAMARLTHPNVVTVYDVGMGRDGQVFVAMELVEGGSLRSALAGGARDAARTLDMYLQAARGLSAAHAAGLVHRDFKPDNVLVGSDGRVRVTDFGLVRGGDGESAPLTLANGRALTATGAILGTPAYMAPEQHLGLPATDKADQYSFAVSLFEGLAGLRPFSGRDLSALRDAKLEGRREPWPAGSDVPEGVRAAIDRALARAPEGRFGSMQELIAVLEAARHAPPPVAAPPPPPLPPIAAPPRMVAPPRASPPALVWLLVPVGVVVLLLAGGALFLARRVVASPGREALPADVEAPPPSVPAFAAPMARLTPDAKLDCPSGAHEVRDQMQLMCFDARGRLDGPMLSFHKSGTLARVTRYEDDRRSGPYWEVDDAGRPTLYATYVAGKLDGTQIELYPDGKVRTETRYRAGLAHGLARRWSPDGELSGFSRYDAGKRTENRSLN